MTTPTEWYKLVMTADPREISDYLDRTPPSIESATVEKIKKLVQTNSVVAIQRFAAEQLRALNATPLVQDLRMETPTMGSQPPGSPQLMKGVGSPVSPFRLEPLSMRSGPLFRTVSQTQAATPTSAPQRTATQ